MLGGLSLYDDDAGDVTNGMFNGPNDMRLDFANNRYWKGTSALTLPGLGYTDTHAIEIKALNAGGSYDNFLANTIVRNNLGGQVVPTATPLLKHTNALTNAAWDKGINITVADSGNASPFSGNNWFTLTAPAATGFTFLRQDIGTQTGDYTIQIIARKNNYRYIGLRPLGSTGIHATFDYDTGAWIVTPAGYTVSSKQIASGIWVLSVTNDAAGNGGNFYTGVVIPDATGSENPTLTGGEKVDIAYIGNEVGSFAIPPIVSGGTPTTTPGNQVVISGLSMPTGVEFCGIFDVQDPGSNYIKLFELNDGTTTNRITLYYSAGDVRVAVFVGGVSQANLILGPWAQGLQGFYFSTGVGYLKAGIVGQAAQTGAPALYPTMTKQNFLGRGNDNTVNTLGRYLESYTRSGFLPNDITSGEIVALTTARLAALS